MLDYTNMWHSKKKNNGKRQFTMKINSHSRTKVTKQGGGVGLGREGVN